MRCVVLSLVINSPDPSTGQPLTQHDLLRSALAEAVIPELRRRYPDSLWNQHANGRYRAPGQRRTLRPLPVSRVE